MSLMIRTEVRPSPIHGVGLFSLEYVKLGDKVSWVCDRCRWYLEPYLQYSTFYVEADLVRRHGYLDSQFRLWCLPCDEMRYCNHSEEPNLRSESFADYAARDILIGEELTVDYRTFDLEWREKLK